MHKANTFIVTDGFWLRCVREVAQRFPDVVLDEIIVDACALGWGAYVIEQSATHCLRQRWNGLINASAWAEPLAVVQVLKWVRKRHTGPRRVAVVR